ncbi:hypothetical protein SDC9_195152 [bioreactor metagenome]|uniref:Uncharacterized protein n=1 Tax=bioreactor metagenome TaxID=1076179 RepID=A0A645IAS2_9ZZZZ
MAAASVYYKERIAYAQVLGENHIGLLYAHLHGIELRGFPACFICLDGQCKAELHLSIVHRIPIGSYPGRVKGGIMISLIA